MTRQPPQPPEPPSGDGPARAGYRGHRQRGEAIAGHHADRPGDPRSGPSQARMAWAASEHDYSHRGLAPLPAWYYVLYGRPVPDDAPRTPPPAGFAALMARRRDASPDDGSGQALPAASSSVGQAGPEGSDGPAAPAPAAPARALPQPLRRRPARPAVATTAEPAAAAGTAPPPASQAQWCRACGYRTDAPGHERSCLGQA